MIKDIKKNWQVLAVAGAVILPVLFLMLVYMPASNELGRLRGRPYNPEPQPVGSKDVEVWKAFKGEKFKNFEYCVKFYTDLANKPHPKLEDWFPELRTRPDQEPEVNLFKAVYDDAKKVLDNDLRKLLLEGHSSWIWEEFIPPASTAEAVKLMKTLQKRFWIRKRFVESLEKAGLKGVNPEFFFFSKTLPIDRPPSPSSRQGVPGYEGFKNELTLIIEDNRDEKNKESIKIAETISFGFRIDLTYEEIPRLMASLLQHDRNPRMFVEITGIRMATQEPTQSALTTSINPITIEVPFNTPENKKQEEVKKALENLKKKMVVYIAARVLVPSSSGMEDAFKYLKSLSEGK